MKHFVLDSFALLVFFEQQKDWEKVEYYLVQASNDKVELSMSLINYGEIFYITAQREGLEEAERIIKIVDGLPIHIVNPDKAQTIHAATHKAEGGISYADCFAAALTEKLSATLVTGDPEFKKLKNKISIDWIEK
jgi:uncharacterized protein